MAPNTHDSTRNEVTDSGALFGRYLSHPPPGEEVCVAGMAGVFPNANNVEEYKYNLFNKIDMVDDADIRWEPFHPEIPRRSGKIPHIEKFDAGFFGIHKRQADSMDPMHRLILERVYEAIYDAGMHPKDFEGTNTGVFLGVCFAETEPTYCHRNLEPNSFVLTGCMRTFMVNRISYLLKLKGPSHTMDTACSSSMFAIENGYRSIRTGACEFAIVGGCNLCLHPFVSLQFSRLGVLGMDGCCKSFDDSGNGYCRSEGVAAIILMKSKYCKRIYAKIVHAKTNCDGFKDLGISYPSGEMQKELLTEFYEECAMDPKSITYLEAHGTGTKVGDPEEAGAIHSIFADGRDTPLLIGSVKSNIGHTEATSGLCSVIKCIIGMEEGYIPPNIYYSKPREEITSLVQGHMKVVSEKTPLPDDRGLMGVSSFGFGGANCHALLHWNPKAKINGGKPKDDLPRLVCFTGRTEEAMTVLTDHINEKFDAEHIALVHEAFSKNMDEHLYRGYTIASKSGMLASSYRMNLEDNRTLILTFGNFGSYWQSIAKQLMPLTIFNDMIKKIHSVLAKSGIDITEIIENSKRLVTHPVVNRVLGTVAIQLGIAEIVKRLELKPAAIFGHSIGEIACAYLDGSLTLEQAMLTALEIGNHLKDMAKTTTTYVVKFVDEKIPKKLPSNVEMTWNYSETTVAVTGEPKAVHDFVSDLQKKGADIIEIGSDEVTLHSKNNVKIESALLQKLKKIIPNPKARSDNWVSASTEATASPEYFSRCLHSPINTQNIVTKFRNSVMFEVGLGQLSQLMNQALNKANIVVDFKQAREKDGLLTLLEALGSLYELGFHPQIQKIYPAVEFPVSRGTPMIGSQIKWNHVKDCRTMKFESITRDKIKTEDNIVVTQKTDNDDNWNFTTGHVIDGRNLFPATGYIKLVWYVLTNIKSLQQGEMGIVFENVRFNRATSVSLERTTFTVQIQKSRFEVVEGGADVVSGLTYPMEDDHKEIIELPLPPENRSDAIAMNGKDVYKELRLRGYNYSGAFRAIQECDVNVTRAYIRWDGNWVSFMDNMLQIKILQLDTRLLYVPTGIKKLSIDPQKHLKYVATFGEENPVLPVYIFKDAEIIKCGGIEIKGLMASSIAKRKPLGEPVLEKYEFVPNEAALPIEQSLRVNMQIALDNLYATKVKVIEIFDEATKKDSEPLGQIIFDVLSDQPLIQANIIALGNVDLDLPNVTVEKDKALNSETDCLLVVGTKLLQRPTILQEAFGCLKENGFIISREELSYEPVSPMKHNLDGVSILTIHLVGNEKLVLFQKTSQSQKPTVIQISEKDARFDWLSKVQNAVKNDDSVVLYAQNEETSGLLGLFNCMKREGDGMKVRCVIVEGKEAPPFDPEHPFYQWQLRKNTAVNIYKNGQWGTYRHLLMEGVTEVESEHCFVNQTIRGDLSSLRWIQGHLSSKTVLPPEKSLVQVYYASLNFRDIMTASGRINADVITMDRTEQECVQGFEFAGRDSTGRRVMGLTVNGALATALAADSYLLFDVPDHWTLEQAATVPAVYGTVLYALLERGRMKKGDSILIHSGTGGVGQAAINVALAHGCTVFTTVGTPEKRACIKKLFPQLTDRQIGNSRDTTFERMIQVETNNRGVDLVLNSLAEEKLLASVRCLALGGRFLEIGKFDLANNNKLDLMLMRKNCSFHGVMLDQFFNSHPLMKKKIGVILSKGIETGAVKPLTTNIFKMNEIEEAFRFMATGKHTGKVLIEIRKEEPQKKIIPKPVLTKGLARYTCDSDHSYIITGGLGGFGLELADWLILRGARKVVLTSRTGLKTGYQAYRLKIWRSYGTIVKISTADITSKEGCEQLISEAEELGPVHSIFNLAVVLKDALFENQTVETFQTSFGPKAHATKHLDEITRKRCPELRDFVIFSSVSCGRGNAGQTNYGMSNSVMERICEKRKREGYPALAIEWGAVGDVGLVAEMQEEHTELEIGGTLQQKISNCIQVMDTFLGQRDAAIVSSMVVAEKKTGTTVDNIVDAAISILGINKKTVSSHSTLAELGMDSMTAVEIKQTLEREFDVFLSAQDIRGLTIARLEEMQEERVSNKEIGATVSKRVPMGMELIFQNLGDAENALKPVIRLPSLVEDSSDAPYVFCFPGVEGYATSLKPLSSKLRAKVIGIQCCYKLPALNYDGIAKESVTQIEKYLKPNEVVNIIAYSWGSIIALEVISVLEKKGHTCNLVVLDGSPEALTKLTKAEIKYTTDAEIESMITAHVLMLYLSIDDIPAYKERLLKCTTFEEKREMFVEAIAGLSPFTPDYQRAAITCLCSRMQECMKYVSNYEKIQAPVKLFKPETLLFSPQLPEDYNLSKQCSNVVEIRTFEGNHNTILDNDKLAEAVNGAIDRKNHEALSKPSAVQTTKQRRVSVEYA